MVSSHSLPSSLFTFITTKLHHPFVCQFMHFTQVSFHAPLPIAVLFPFIIFASSRNISRYDITSSKLYSQIRNNSGPNSSSLRTPLVRPAQSAQICSVFSHSQIVSSLFKQFPFDTSLDIQMSFHQTSICNSIKGFLAVQEYMVHPTISLS